MNLLKRQQRFFGLTLALVLGWTGTAHAVPHLHPQQLAMLASSCRDLLIGDPSGRAHQPTSDITTLYHQAETVMPSFGRLIDDLTNLTGATHETVALKAFERSGEKVSGRKGGDAAQLFDILRSTVLCKNLDQVYFTLMKLRNLAEARGFEIVQIKDRFQSPKENGYRDLNIRVKLPLQTSEGPTYHIAELQIHLKELYELKKTLGDPIYRKIRAIEEAAGREERALTLTEKAQLDSLKQEHRDGYDQVYAAIVDRLAH